MNAQGAPVTKFLLLSNILLFFVSSFGYLDLHTFGLVPQRFLNGDGWWMPVTSMFMHAGWLHITFNMIALWSLGTPMEMTLGSQRFAWLYGVSGMGSALAVILWHLVEPTVHPTVGASGAIFGLLGALAVFYPNSLMLFFFIPMKARTVVIVVGVLSVAMILSDKMQFLSHTGHLGGLVAGLLYSRFALGLPLIKNVLNQSGSRAQPYFSGGGAGRQTSTEAAARAAVDRFFRGTETSDRDPGIFTGRRSGEKVVNPDPASWQAEPADRPSPDRSASDRPAAAGPSAGGPPADSPPAGNAPAGSPPGGPANDDSAPAGTPPGDSARETNENAAPPSGGKRLHFDQETGRFYFK